MVWPNRIDLPSIRALISTLSHQCDTARRSPGTAYLVAPERLTHIVFSMRKSGQVGTENGAPDDAFSFFGGRCDLAA